jgi:hypothetical protein
MSSTVRVSVAAGWIIADVLLGARMRREGTSKRSESSKMLSHDLFNEFTRTWTRRQRAHPSLNAPSTWDEGLLGAWRPTDETLKSSPEFERDVEELTRAWTRLRGGPKGSSEPGDPLTRR